MDILGGNVNLQPLGGLLELGLEAGPKWLTIDASVGFSGGSLTGLKIDDEMVTNKIGAIDWSNPLSSILRVGAAIPLSFERVRLNIGGGVEWMLIGVNTTGNLNKLDDFFIPYLGARLDFGLSKRGWVPFIGYRCEFMPADKFEIYFGESSSLRHNIFAGLERHGAM